MKIKSLTDVITNSSTQVYTLNLGEDKKAIDFIKARGHWPGEFKEFNSLDDVKNWIKDYGWYWPCRWNQGGDPEYFPKYNPYDDYGSNPWIDKEELKKYIDESLVEEFFKGVQLPEYETGDYLSNIGKSEEEFWDLIKPLFSGIVGNAILTYSSEDGFRTEDFQELQDLFEYEELEIEEQKKKWLDDHDFQPGDKIHVIYKLFGFLELGHAITYKGNYEWERLCKSLSPDHKDVKDEGRASDIFKHVACNLDLIAYEIEKHK